MFIDHYSNDSKGYKQNNKFLLSGHYNSQNIVNNGGFGYYRNPFTSQNKKMNKFYVKRRKFFKRK